MDAVSAALAEALALVLPVACAGCGEPDVAVCEACLQALEPRVRRGALADGTPVWSALPFEGAVGRVIRALKEEGRTGLARVLAPALAAALAAAVAAGVAAGGRVAGGGVAAVPVPTSRAAFVRRGFRVVDLIAARAGLRVVRGLRTVRATADQRGLGQDARRRNVAGSMVARGVAGVAVVVVDDVATTGATLDEAVRALRAAGAEVVGAATVAATPRRSPAVPDGVFDAFETRT